MQPPTLCWLGCPHRGSAGRAPHLSTAGACTCLRTKPSSWQPCPGGASTPASTLLPGQLTRCGPCCRDSRTSPSPALGRLRESPATVTRGPYAYAYATSCT